MDLSNKAVYKILYIELFKNIFIIYLFNNII